MLIMDEKWCMFMGCIIVLEGILFDVNMFSYVGLLQLCVKFQFKVLKLCLIHYIKVLIICQLEAQTSSNQPEMSRNGLNRIYICFWPIWTCLYRLCVIVLFLVRI